MNDKPILFSGPMVRALLEGRKTQTRRIIKKPNKIMGKPVPDNFEIDPYSIKQGAIWRPKNKNTGGFEQSCPHGQPGDLLWVRETFWHYGKWVKNGLTKTGKQAWKFKPLKNPYKQERVQFVKPHYVPKNREEIGFHKRPSIFLPRWASRITLEIKDIRVERLHDITWEDAKAEGINTNNPVLDFDGLWTKINGPDSWWQNPWVWAISFDVYSINIDDFIAAKEAA